MPCIKAPGYSRKELIPAMHSDLDCLDINPQLSTLVSGYKINIVCRQRMGRMRGGLDQPEQARFEGRSAVPKGRAQLPPGECRR
jgi:hypothetical protein